MSEVNGNEVVLSLSEYQSLVQDSQELAQLKAAGVKSWKGYSSALGESTTGFNPA